MKQVVHTDEDVAIALFNAHIRSHTADAGRNNGSDREKRKKLTELKITQGMSMDSWNSFQVLWKLYKDDADLSEADRSLQLIYCCSEELKRQLFRADPKITAKPEIKQLKSIRKLAVVPDAMGVRHYKMLNISQEVGERPRVLLEKEQGEEATCELKCAEKCCREEEESVEFTDVTVKYALVNGLAAAEIRSEVLDRNLLEENSQAETIAFVEQKETARHALKGGGEKESVNFAKHVMDNVETPRDVLGWDLLNESSRADAVTFIEQREMDRDACRGKATIVKTGYREQQTTVSSAVEAKLHVEIKCRSCIARVSQNVRGQLGQLSEHRLCKKCWKSTLQRRDTEEPGAKADKEDTVQAEGESSLATSNTWSPSCQSTGATEVRNRARNCNICAWENHVKVLLSVNNEVTMMQSGKGVNVALDHHIFDYGFGWLKGRVWKRPSGDIYSKPRIHATDVVTMRVDGIADTGAQVSLWCAVDFYKSEYKKKNLINVKKKIAAINSQPIEVMGAVFLAVRRNSCETNLVAFMTPEIQGLYLSRQALAVLLIIPNLFPTAEDAKTRAEEEGTDERVGNPKKGPEGVPTTGLHRMVGVPKPNKIPWRAVSPAPLEKSCKRETHITVPSVTQAWLVLTHPWKILTDAGSGQGSALIRETDKHLTTFTPQGYAPSNDGYSKRHDRSIESAEFKTKLAEGAIMENVGKHGILLNGAIFQSRGKMADFAGVRISGQRVESLHQYLESIALGPTPRSVGDVRSGYAIKRDMDTDESARPMKLRTSHSKTGLGIYLAPERGEYTELDLGCRISGWRRTSAGSRILKSSVKLEIPGNMEVSGKLAGTRYTWWLGKGLGVGWASEQVKYFTLDCLNEVIVVDHKATCEIFGDNIMEDAINSRIQQHKEGTLSWKVSIIYRPDEANYFANDMSQYPVATSDDDGKDNDNHDDDLRSEVSAVFQSKLRPLTSLTFELLIDDVPEDKSETNHEFQEFWEHRDKLSIVGDALWCNGAVVIPTKLRQAVLDILGSARQGVQATRDRAANTAFRPTSSEDISKHGNTGIQYLVAVDRLSKWIEVMKTPPASVHSGSKGLIRLLRESFLRFGVPARLSSDVGPELTGKVTQDFFKRWGIQNRLSSAYVPRSNGGIAVNEKATRRLSHDNIRKDGSLYTDKLATALMNKRNTPEYGSKLAPAEIMMGKRLQAVLPIIPKDVMVLNNPSVSSAWRDLWSKNESIIQGRYLKDLEGSPVTKSRLQPLAAHVKVSIQSQNDESPFRWDKTGVVVEVLLCDQYIVKIHGSGRLTRGHKKFLRAYVPAVAMKESNLPYSQDTDLERESDSAWGARG